MTKFIEDQPDTLEWKKSYPTAEERKRGQEMLKKIYVQDQGTPRQIVSSRPIDNRQV
jgi:hypothetical protein